MKKQNKHLVELILAVLLGLVVIPMWGQEGGSAGYITVSGVVKDKQSRKDLEYVNVSVPGSNIGTVTNSDGAFTLKLDSAEHIPYLEISHIGYRNVRVNLKPGNLDGLKILLSPYTNILGEVIVYANNPRYIVEEAIRKIPLNYSGRSNMLTGFYRETVQKGRRYINISEAVIHTYKTSYESREQFPMLA